jgi:hypothetical protein
MHFLTAGLYHYNWQNHGVLSNARDKKTSKQRLP